MSLECRTQSNTFDLSVNTCTVILPKINTNKKISKSHVFIMNWVKSANVYEYVGYAIVIVIILIECLTSCKCNYEDMISFG